MKNVSATLTVVLLALILPRLAYSQEAPVYKEGDWWRVKVEYEFKEGFEQRSPGCHEEYSEYLVEINQGNPNVYGLSGTKKEAIDCPKVTEQLLNIPNRMMFLKFPLKVNKSWSHRYQDHMDRWRYSDMKVVASEKVRTPKAEFDAIKIKWLQSGHFGDSTRIYYYSPKAKAIVLHDIDGAMLRKKITVVDFNVK